MPQDSLRVSVLLGVLFGLAGMGSSSAAIVLPTVAADFGVGVGVAAWTISLYVLMLAVTTAVHGRVSDLVGVRLPLLIGIGMMTGGALLAALAPSYGVLLVARMFQGAGAAAVPTLGVTLLSARYHGEVRALALGRLAGLAAAVSCFGPLVGGIVADVWGWRAVMALPILGVLVLPFLWQVLTGGGTGARLDVLGAVLVASTAAGVVLLLQSPTTGRLVAVAGLLLVLVGVPLVAVWVRRRPHGFLPLAVVRNPTVVRSAVAAAAVPAAWFAQLVGVPAVMVGHGWEPWQVGLLLLPSAAFALVVPRHVGPLLARFGPTRCLALAGLVAAGALVLAAVGTAVPTAWALVPAVVLATVSFGIGQPALSSASAMRSPTTSAAWPWGWPPCSSWSAGASARRRWRAWATWWGYRAAWRSSPPSRWSGSRCSRRSCGAGCRSPPGGDTPGSTGVQTDAMRVLIGPDHHGSIGDGELRDLYAPPSTPWLRASMVSTLDGAVTGESGRSGAISNDADRRIYALLRELADVVVVGAGTARIEGYRPADRPIVVVSRSGHVPEKLRGAEPGRVVLATCRHAPELAAARRQLPSEDVLLLGSHRVDLRALRDRLEERGFEHLLCEGGPHLLRDLLDQEVVDELDATVVPQLVSGLHPRVTDGPPIDVPLELKVLLEDRGTLLGRWFV